MKHGIVVRQLHPHQIAGLSNINQVATGFSHGLALDNTGAIFSWGLNTHGAVGIGSSSALIPTAQRVPLSNAVQRVHLYRASGYPRLRGGNEAPAPWGNQLLHW